LFLLNFSVPQKKDLRNKKTRQPKSLLKNFTEAFLKNQENELSHKKTKRKGIVASKKEILRKDMKNSLLNRKKWRRK